MDHPNSALSSDLKRYKVKKRSLDIKIYEKLLKKESQTFSEHFNIFMVRIRRKVASFINPENKQNFSQLFDIKNLLFDDEEDFPRITEEKEEFEFVEPMVFDLVSPLLVNYLKYLQQLKSD